MLEALAKRVRTKPSKKGYKNPNYKISEEGKLRVKEACSKKVLNKDTMEIYSSLTEAALKLNGKAAYLSRVLNNKNITNKSKYNIEWLK
jgi:hypothetical protein